MMKKIVTLCLVMSSVALAQDIDYSKIDCNKINAVSRNQCFEKQRQLAQTATATEEKQPMTLFRARAIIEAADDIVAQCKIKLDVYGANDDEHYKPCIRDMAKMMGDNGKDYQEALQLVSQGIESKEIGLYDGKRLTDMIQNTAVNLEYISIRASSK